jgi:Fe-S-cluster containining protein
MILTASELKQNAISKASENQHFLEAIRLYRSAELDALAGPIIDKAYKTINCLDCGNCCKQLRPPFTPTDVERIAKQLSVSDSDFTKQYLEDVKSKEFKIMACNPCTFLDEKACRMYAIRPDSCADYPHLHHPGFKYRIRSILENYSICPIVVEVVDELKERIAFGPSPS